MVENKYIKNYQKLMEAKTNLTDVLNFLGNTIEVGNKINDKEISDKVFLVEKRLEHFKSQIDIFSDDMTKVMLTLEVLEKEVDLYLKAREKSE